MAASTYTMGDGTTMLLIEGDIPVRDEVALRAIYDRLVSPDVDKSLVRHVAGEDVVLEDGAQLDVTYCVASSWPASSTSFNSAKGFSETGAERRAIAIGLMAGATRAWSSAANVYFRYVPSEDVNCVPGYGGVDINVVNYDSGNTSSSPPACSTFPDGSSCEGYSRSLAVNFNARDIPDRMPIFIHEVGHIFGLAHEHYGSGDDDNNGRVDVDNSDAQCLYSPLWRRLTASVEYDSQSIMGYDLCNMSPGSTLSFLDGVGIRVLYGAPAVWNIPFGLILM